MEESLYVSTSVMMSYVPLGLIACVVTAGYSLKYRRPWFWRIVYVIVTFGGSLLCYLALVWFPNFEYGV